MKNDKTSQHEPVFWATIAESGNGWPSVGEYVVGDDGEPYRVLDYPDGNIYTGQRPGQSNWLYARVELADWTDLCDDEVECSAKIEGTV